MTLWSILVVLACSGKEDSTPVEDTEKTFWMDDSGPTDDSGVELCDIEILDIRPVAGTEEAYYRSNIEFRLDEPDPDAVISLEQVIDEKKSLPLTGKQWTSPDGLIVYFTPDEPMLPDTDYKATLDWCGGKQPISFETSGIGTPMDDPGSSISGNVYSFDLTEGRFVEPPLALDGILEIYIESTLLVWVESASKDWITIETAVGNKKGAQDMCKATAGYSPANFTSNPYFDQGPATLVLDIAGVQVEIEDIEISGAFPEDGSSLEWVTFEGTWDTRPLDGPVGGEGKVCNIAAGLGRDCFACDDGKPYCLDIKVDELTATKVAGPVEEIAAACSHEDCVSSECEE